MKTQTVVTDITHDDLVNLLCTAHEGNDWLGFSIPKGNYVGTELENESDCREDRWAKVLLSGRTLFAEDHYAEDKDEFYGSLPHKWCFFDTPDEGWIRYTFSLEDIKKGLGRAYSSGGYLAKYVRDLMDDDSTDFDLTEAEALMQFILFGEEIYG